MRLKALFLLGAVCAGGAASAAPQLPGGSALSFGTTPTPAELSKFFAYKPDGATLPPGSGTVAQGREVFASACSACHGDALQGIPPTGAPALAGGRGTLTSAKPKKTVESYWPYATTLFDYIKRAMPFYAPGSLSNDQIYAVVAYILAVDKVVPDNAVMDRTTLPRVVLPNRYGFTPFPGPDRLLYH